MNRDNDLGNDDNDCDNCSDDGRGSNDRPGWMSARVGYDYDDSDDDNDKPSGLATFRVGYRDDKRSGHKKFWVGDEDDDDTGINPIN